MAKARTPSPPPLAGWGTSSGRSGSPAPPRARPLPGGIARWLQDPQRVSPGTKMPSFFADETSGPEDILDGDEERQMLALRDYILSLGGAGSTETGHPAAPAK